MHVKSLIYVKQSTANTLMSSDLAYSCNSYSVKYCSRKFCHKIFVKKDIHFFLFRII